VVLAESVSAWNGGAKSVKKRAVCNIG